MPTRSPGEYRELHPTFSALERAERLRRGVQLFNSGEAYAAHEVWEDVWRSANPEPKRLVQGLIQVAAVLHQILALHRRSGPRGTLEKALRNLEPYAHPGETPERTLGLDIPHLIRDLERVRTWLALQEGELPVPLLRILEPDALR